jgi:hypothetical protein
MGNREPLQSCWKALLYQNTVSVSNPLNPSKAYDGRRDDYFLDSTLLKKPAAKHNPPVSNQTMFCELLSFIFNPGIDISHSELGDNLAQDRIVSHALPQKIIPLWQ